MESTTAKRVRESSSRRRPEQNKRHYYSSSPAPRSSQKKRKVKSKSEQYWPLKDPGILDEKFESNRWYYLVAWADTDPSTGKEYAPSWEPYNNVTDDERTKWQKRKLENSQEHSEQPSPPAPIDWTQDSEPTRSAKRKRSPPVSARSLSPTEKLPRKFPRVVRSASPAGAGELFVRKTEIKDSYEEENSHLGLVEAGPQVEVGINEDFDKTAYVKVAPSSQPSQISSQPGASSIFRSPAARARPSSFIWDEDIIPDSQDAHGSSSFKPGETESGTYQSVNSPSLASRSHGEASLVVDTQSPFAEETHSDRPSSNRSTSSFVTTSGQSRQLPPWQNSLEIEESQNQAEISEPSVISLLHSPEDTNGNLLPQSQPQLLSSPPFQTQLPPLWIDQTTRSQSPLSARDSAHVDLTLESESRTSKPSIRPSIPPTQRPASIFKPTIFPGLNIESNLNTARPASALLSLLAPQVISDRIKESDPSLGANQQSIPIPQEDILSSSHLPSPPLEHVVSSIEPVGDTLSPPPVTPIAASSLRNRTPIIEPDQSRSPHTPDSSSSNMAGPMARPSMDDEPQNGQPFIGSNQRVDRTSTSLQQTEHLERNRPTISAPPRPSYELPVPSRLASNQQQVAPSDRTYQFAPPPQYQHQDVASNSFSHHPQPLQDLYSQQIVASDNILRLPPLRPLVSSQQHIAASDNVPHLPTPSPLMSYQQQPVASNNTLQQSIEDNGSKSSPSEEAMPDVSTAPSNLQMDSEEPEEYIVPLPMVAHTRDIYRSVIRNSREYITSFLNDEVFDTSLVTSIDDLLDDLQKICDHQNLHEDDSSTQMFDDVVVQARWAENISTKCLFLAEFLILMKSTDRKFTILVRPGKMLQILEAICKYHGFVYSIAGQADVFGDINASLMRITLLPTTGEEFFVTADFIIAFDATYTAVPNLERLRLNSSYPNRQIPLISLIIIHSVEHLEKFYSTDMEPIQRKIAIVGQLRQLRDSMGKLPLGGEYHDTFQATKVVSQWIKYGANPGTWPLLPLPEIDDLEYESQQTESREQESSTSYHNGSSLAQPPLSAIKRSLEDDDAMNSESPKRQRLTPVPGESAATHISDTVLPTSSIPYNLTSANNGLTSTSPDEEDEARSLLKRLRSLEIKLKAKESKESKLLETISDLQFRVDDLSASITVIAPKYQDALHERAKYERDCNLAVTRESQATQSLESKIAAFEKLKGEKAIVDEELAMARKSLLESTVPDIARLESLRAEITSLKESYARLEKGKEAIASTLEYVQQAYQTASSSNSEANTEIQELRAQNEILKRKADENSVKIHEIQLDQERKLLRQQVKHYKGMVKDREMHLERAQREKEALGSVRRGTRGASTGPRSPRMGTMSPSSRLGGQSRFAVVGGNGYGNGSRGNSPAPNEFGGDGGSGIGRSWGVNSGVGTGTTRVGGFGEVLFAQDRDKEGSSGREKGPLRFGNHLQ